MEVQADHAENKVQDELNNEVQDSLGMNESSNVTAEAKDNEPQEAEKTQSKESLAVQKRLKAQKRAHEREVRELHARIGELESRMQSPNQPAHDPYMSSQGGGVDEQIHKAVSYALQQKDLAERKAHEAQQQAHVQRQYQDFQRHLDSVGDKYDDFHDVVFGSDTPYTPAMRDYALTLPRQGAGSAGEVLYKLGKNREELERISKLHPLDQASEIAKLSHALISGGNGGVQAQSSRPLGQIKSNPVTSSHMQVTANTPPSTIRARMKAGTWK